MIQFVIGRPSVGNDIKVLITYYIDKISSPCLLISIYSGLLPASYTLSRGTSNYHTSELPFPTSPSICECANTI